MKNVIPILAALLMLHAPLAAHSEQTTPAGPRTDTLAAWNAYVNQATDRPARPGTLPPDQSIDIPGGTIYHSSGSVLVRHTNVDRVIRALMYPGTPPPQDDVLESKVLSRDGNTLRVYLKLARTAIITVVYDTEHQVIFTRHSPGVATSRSVSIRIAEHGGGDRGFLWRLNSYWRYSQVGSDVRIDLESISLSRPIPGVARPIASPIIDRIARESLHRTLDSVQRFLQAV